MFVLFMLCGEWCLTQVPHEYEVLQLHIVKSQFIMGDIICFLLSFIE